jgi:hypothetical protein
VKEHIAILGDLHLTGTANEHLHGALGAEVGLEDLLETLGRVDVHGEGLGATKDVGLGI